MNTVLIVLTLQFVSITIMLFYNGVWARKAHDQAIKNTAEIDRIHAQFAGPLKILWQYADKMRGGMGWISVNDNLPNIGDAVLTCDPQGYVQILHYLNGYDWLVSDGKTFETNRQSLPVGFYENTTKPYCRTGYEVNTDITYWMPLPEPPSPAP